MISTLKPPSISTSSIKFFPTCTCITTIWWSMATIAHVGSRWTNLGYTGWTSLISLKVYHLMSSTILMSCPKLITYLVSRTWMLMFPKTSSKIFYGIIVCVVKWTWCLSMISWFTGSSKQPNLNETIHLNW